MQEAQRLARLEALLLRLREDLDGRLLVVEGRRDKEALIALGFGSAVPIHRGLPLADLADQLAAQAGPKGVVLLLDQDRTGRRLHEQLVNLLAGRIPVDVTSQAALFQAVLARCIEDIPAELAGLRERQGAQPTN